MFKKPGKKLKIVAIIFTVILIIGPIIGGLITFSVGGSDSWIALPIMLGGPIFGWISGLMMYGLGELVENSAMIVQTLCNKDTENE